MSLLSFKIAKNFTKILIFSIFFFVHVSVKAWEVDLSRRNKELKSLRVPASIVDQSVDTSAKKDDSWMVGFFNAVEPTQEIVIMNTEKGFVPETIRLKKGNSYKIHVVNINTKGKNTSFIMDSFGEHHATYFGEQKAFTVAPKMEGVFSFQCPETAFQGRVVVFSDSGPSDRKPAGE